MRKLLGFLPAFALVAGLSQVANAAEVTRVASSFDKDNGGSAFGLHFGVSYDFDFKKAAILRESEGRVARDLIYRQLRHSVTPTIEIGLWHDLSVYVALPVVVSDNRNYQFDKELGSDCVFAQPGGDQANCVNKFNSTTLRDGLIGPNGYDAFNDGNPEGEFTDPNTDMIFRAPTRRGLDQIHVGMKIGLLSQARKPHLPNWVVGLEGRFAIGKPMTFDRDIQTQDRPGNHRVGRGIHELGVWTALSRRYRWLDPFFGAYWRQAIKAGRTEFAGRPMSETGTYFGSEIIAWENQAQQKKVSFILAGTATLFYNGQAYSEVWELLANSPAFTADGGHNGITKVQDFGSFSVNAGLNFHMGPYARLNFGADLRTDTRHLVTGGGGTSHPRVDSVGRRYLVDDVLNINGYFNFLVTF